MPFGFGTMRTLQPFGRVSVAI